VHQGADVNAQDFQGSAPLHKAAMNNHDQCLVVLLRARAKINSVTLDQKTPLVRSCLPHLPPCIASVLIHSTPRTSYVYVVVAFGCRGRA